MNFPAFLSSERCQEDKHDDLDNDNDEYNCGDRHDNDSNANDIGKESGKRKERRRERISKSMVRE